MIHMGGRTGVRPHVIIFRPIPTPQKKIKWNPFFKLPKYFCAILKDSLWKFMKDKEGGLNNIKRAVMFWKFKFKFKFKFKNFTILL